MDKDTKIIFVILAIIVVLIGVFIFKVVKTNNKKDETTSIEQNQVSVPDSKNDKLEEVENERRREEKKGMTKVLENETKKSVIFLTILPLIAYILQSLAIYKLSKQEGIEKAWLAFIPYAQWILVAKIGFEGSIIPGIIYIAIKIANIFIKNDIITLIASALILYILHKLFKKYSNISKFGLGNLCALILIVIIILYLILLRVGKSSFMLALLANSVSLTAGVYLYFFSRKVTEWI